MLVLSRKLSEKIVIGSGPEAVVITVVDIDRGKIRLGIEAPREVPIYREELVPGGEGKSHGPNRNSGPRPGTTPARGGNAGEGRADA